ncbi:uncharacterized protein LOC129720157 [Wyeomyia smithii]|uniref:uncharacterized protein LOC129720157 n=1 Tax=Wyeomyia smithii TaxID=174621 RepID=UPI002468126C|nr:uncharacterized protein LOC129720157 [Wyeomyia smithii]
MKDEEILEEMKSEKVIKVERIMKKIDGVLTKTSSLILTISTALRPDKIKVGFLYVPTRPYYPRPMRCFQCLRYGHLGRDCKAEKTCVNCGDNFHGDDCTKKAKCVNCQKPHEATSPDYDMWRKETAIIHLRIGNNIPYRDARKLYEQQNQTRLSYASTTALGADGCKCKCTCNKTPENFRTTEVVSATPQPIQNTPEPTGITEIADEERTPTNTAKSQASTSEDNTPPPPKQKKKTKQL